jgi:hypothetical protein
MEPKDKCTHNKKHDHVYICIKNMFVIVDIVHETQGRRERMKRMIINKIKIHYVCAGGGHTHMH